MGTAREFLVADLNVAGELQLREAYSYSALEQVPGAGDLIVRCATALRRNPELFEIGLSPTSAKLTLRWSASAKSAGIATVRCEDQLMSLSLLASGKDPDADSITIQAFQTYLLRELHDTGVEPAFALMDLKERPLVATINFRSPPIPAEVAVVALADRCFAAAYFRYHNLA
jgi:hypothetical protein